MMIREIISAILLIVGFIFILLSTVGVMRLPDFFTRLHSSSIGETIGIFLIGFGMIVYEGMDFTSAKIFMIIVAIFFANPVGTHLIGKAALRSGHKLEEYVESELEILERDRKHDKCHGFCENKKGKEE